MGTTTRRTVQERREVRALVSAINEAISQRIGITNDRWAEFNGDLHDFHDTNLTIDMEVLADALGITQP